ncbi:MAG: hypothetical protein QGH23_00290 [Dehalococcoidia bacterium]|nr:hypothetical protein [Dehalococcoidia bacterium]MDP6509643.1 hypothetical protein [Dehalococcoidia bacterium]MDP6782843.1 hypothetical protein [Dehalococcoidia bacterium]
MDDKKRMAAALAGIACYIEGEATPPPTGLNPWLLMGRREQMLRRDPRRWRRGRREVYDCSAWR